MKCLISSTQFPVTFTVGGEFRTSLPWKHDVVCNEDYELFIMLKGSLYLNLDDRSVTLKHNEILLVPSGVTISGREKSSNLSFLWLHFLPSKDSDLREFDNQEIKPMLAKDGYRQYVLPVRTKVENTDHLVIAAYDLLNRVHNDVYEFEKRNFLMTNILLIISSEFSQRILAEDADRQSARISQIKKWICEHLDSSLRVSKISQIFGLSEEYLSRTFREHEGMTIVQYMNVQKIKVAKVLLLQSSLSIKEVSNFSYFQNEKQFFLQFKRITGTTPLSFREAHNGIHTNDSLIDPDLPIPKRAKFILRGLEEK
ncbi:AraC family transcriptional regulator [Lentilactobacillus sunkii]|uniref:AraC family transcriptional regulator n=1 Tax=Lentilactobacillus sunkii DSM 19904 TaxID=1423808 RepID=A0A0R1L219_9LACO|nr:AraC family transcriptional regulator [Lentilactobacillus sunkii]KRK89592.1 AraC family transcriptional regulator [Lentilactobacillus sunkii DSM 19904]